jgi:hypothetical protein
VCKARQLDVIHVATTATDKSQVFEAGHALAYGELTHGNFNLSASCATGPVTGREEGPCRVNLL